MDRVDKFFQSKKNEYAVVIIFFLLLSVIFTWPLLLHLHDGIIGPRTDPLLNTWIISWNAKTVFSNPTHLFQGNIMYPCRDVLAYSEHLFGMGVLAAPVYYASGNPILAYNFLIFFCLLFSAFGCYLLAKELTGSRWGGLVAGIFFAFCPFKMSKLCRLHIFFSPFLPFMLLYLYRFLCKGRKKDLLWFGIFFLAQSLSSWHYLVYCILAAGLMWVWFAVFSRRKEQWLRLAMVVIAVLIAALIIMPFAQPYIRANRRLPDFERSLQDLESGSAKPQHYLTVLPQQVVYGRFLPPPLQLGYMRMENVLFPGMVIIFLALAGLLLRRRDDDTSLAFDRLSFRKGALYFLALTIIGVILSFGADIAGVNNILYTIPYHLGLFKFIRAPSRFYVLAALGLAVLAGYGTAKITVRYSQWRKSLGSGRLLAVVLLLLLLLELATFNFAISLVPVHGDVPDVYTWLNEQEDVRIIELPTAFADLTRQGEAMYYSIYHGQKTANGYSGYNPYISSSIFFEMEGFPSERSIDLLRGLNIDYVVWHWDWVDYDSRAEYEERLSSTPGLVRERDYGDMVVYRIEGRGAASPHDLEVSFLAPVVAAEGEDINPVLLVENPSGLPFVMAEESLQPYTLRFLDKEGGVISEFTGEYRAPLFLESGEKTLVELEPVSPPGVGRYRMEITLLGGILGEKRFLSPIEIKSD